VIALAQFGLTLKYGFCFRGAEEGRGRFLGIGIDVAGDRVVAVPLAVSPPAAGGTAAAGGGGRGKGPGALLTGDATGLDARGGCDEGDCGGT